MIRFAVICLFCVAAFAAAEDKPEPKYTQKFDNIDLKQIYQSPRLLDNYFKCLTNEGKCTPDGAELKKFLPDALETECAKCSDTQKEKAREMIVWLVKNHPEKWNVLADLYDPKKVYRVKYEELAKDAGVTISSI